VLLFFPLPQQLFHLREEYRHLYLDRLPHQFVVEQVIAVTNPRNSKNA
jgi:hypothetical protein